MQTVANPYCQTLGIGVPSLEKVKEHREANAYSLLIVALLERGDAMTLIEVAERFEDAGVAPTWQAWRSLKRCRPARAPVYRDGDRYALDPHDANLDLWAFRLGLRPPKAPRLEVVRPEPGPAPLPEPHHPLSPDELDEAWRDAGLHSWSAQRLAVAVLDAHGGKAMSPHEVVAFVGARTRWHGLTPDSAKFRRWDSAVRVREDGRWEMGPNPAALIPARDAVRARIAMVRRWAAMRQDPAVLEAREHAAERRRSAHAAELARLRRVIVHAFPAKAPEMIVLLDVGRRHIETLTRGDFEAARERIAAYDLIAALDVRALLRALDIDPGERRLADLGPPQKSKRLNRRGRVLRIDTSMLIRGSCGIARPLGEEGKLSAYLRDGETTRLRRRLEADAKSLLALYEYGRLHHAVRLRWGFLDEMIPAPWAHRDEPGLYELMSRAHERGEAMEVVAGSAPGWSDPWSRALRCQVEDDGSGYALWLVDEDGLPVDECEVQLARLAPATP
jgi:hypothetical protein